MPTPDEIAVRLIREHQDRTAAIQVQRIEVASATFIAQVSRTRTIGGGPALRSFWSRIDAAAALLLDDTTSIIDAGISRIFEKAVGIWSTAGKAESDDNEADYLKFLAPLIAGVGLGAMLGPQTWKTVLRQHVLRAAREVGTIYSDLLQRGMDPDLLARRLRRYVIGAETFQRAFPADGDIVIDLRSIAKESQGAANQMVFNATRIAFTEFHNARARAEVDVFHRDPLVHAVKWTLSPNRGTLKSPDECDLLAYGDYYGLGPGIFPVSRVPGIPHPFDRCELFPVRRPWSERDLAKPTPSLILSPLDPSVPFPRGNRITATAALRARQSAYQAIVNYR